MTFKTKITTLATLLTVTNARIRNIDRTFTNETSKYPVVAEGINECGNLHLKLTKPQELTAHLVRGANNEVVSTFPSLSTDIHQEFNCLPRGYYRLFLTDDDKSAKITAKPLKQTEITEATEGKETMSPMAITGDVHAFHSHGELTPSELNAYWYYQYAFIAEMCIVAVWLCSMWKFKKSLVSHHFAIAAVLGIIMTETIVCLLRMRYINHYGTSTTWIDLVDIQVKILRETGCRLLIILISLGWGITLPSSQITPSMKGQLVRFGVMYYVGACAAHYCLFQLAAGWMTHRWIVWPIIAFYALLDTFIVCTVMVNLGDIMKDLKKEKQYEKLEHYRKFSNSLLLIAELGAALLILESFIMDREHWYEYFHLVDLVRICVWHLLLLLCVVSVMVQWRPTKEARSFAYVQQISQVGDTPELVEATDCELGVGVKEFDPKGPDGEQLDYKLDLGMDLSVETVADPEVDEVSEFDDSLDFDDFVESF